MILLYGIDYSFFGNHDEIIIPSIISINNCNLQIRLKLLDLELKIPKKYLEEYKVKKRKIIQSISMSMRADFVRNIQENYYKNRSVF